MTRRICAPSQFHRELNFDTKRPSERELIERIRRVENGQIENLVIIDGQPVFDPAPVETQNLALGKAGEHGRSRPASDSANLKDHFNDLFGRLRRLRKRVLVTIKVQNGLPVRLIAPVTDTRAGSVIS